MSHVASELNAQCQHRENHATSAVPTKRENSCEAFVPASGCVEIGVQKECEMERPAGAIQATAMKAPCMQTDPS